jgi:hypothetical protein
MSRFVSLIWLTAAACGAAPPGASGPLANVSTSTASAPAVAGDYRAAHVIRVVCDGGTDGWCDENVEDHMTIHDSDAGSIAVTIELIQTNAHTCTFDGTLRSAPAHASHTRRWTFDGHDDEGACSLVIEQSTSKVMISSEGCRYYCGMRASLDAVFPAIQPR